MLLRLHYSFDTVHKTICWILVATRNIWTFDRTFFEFSN